ncbi:MAG: serine aminopeptidase domain-containing protein, partial [Exilispira sp.]
MEDQFKSSIFNIKLSEGFNLFIKSYTNKFSKDLLLIIPDIGETAFLYDNIIKNFFLKNFSIIIFDLPGHGNTEGKRGNFFAINIYREIIDKILSLFDIKNGIHVFVSGLSSPFFLNVLYEKIDNLWIRSIFISGFTFFYNYKFFLNLLFTSIIKFHSNCHLYPYIFDKIQDKNKFKKFLTTNEIIVYCSYRLIFNFLISIKKALNNIYKKPIPLFIASGNKQEAFLVKDNALNKFRTKKRLPLKIYIFDGGHSIQFTNN